MATLDAQANGIESILERLDRMETMLADLIRQRAVKDWYTTDEVAEILGKAKFTVREWCRHGRVHCRKKSSGRGMHRQWVIAHEELLRFQREGLLPLERASSRIQ
jgi:DNA-directed RNA polymerase specialized sigma24 family protein